MISLGLVAEGLTDQIVIENILAGYFNSPDLDIRQLQPEIDKDNENKSTYGGWPLVFDYCKSRDFQEALQFIDYIIIQIDTDVSESEHYNIPKQDENGEFTPQQLIEKVIEKFRVRSAMILTANINKKLYLQSPYILLSVGFFHCIIPTQRKNLNLRTVSIL
jgi:hypothetical protein